MAAHSSAALPVPSVLEVGAAGDGFFAVSERAHGGMLDDLDGPGMRAALPGLLAALDALRDIDVPTTGGYGIWTPEGTGPAPGWAQALLAVGQETARVPGWRAALAASPVGIRPFDQGYARLRELALGLPDAAPPHSRRPGQPQRARPGRTDHRGHRLGERPVRGLALRPGVADLLVAVAPAVAGHRHRRRAAEPIGPSTAASLPAWITGCMPACCTSALMP